MYSFRTTILAFLITIPSIIYAQDDFTLTIDGEEIAISLDEVNEIKIDGKSYEVLLVENDTLHYQIGDLNIMYPKGQSISETDLGDGLIQYSLVDASGSGYLVQHYTDMNPSFIREFMLNEITKTDVEYGYTLDRKDREVEINGEQVEVISAELTYQGEKNTYEIFAISNKDSGYLIVTMANFIDDLDTNLEPIEMLWGSLLKD